MQTLKLASALLAVLVAAVASAQSPAAGKIVGRTYSNPTLHIAYTWPAMLQPKPLPTPDKADSSAQAYSFPLFIAAQGNQPYGIVLVAEKTNVASAHSSSIKTAAEYIDRLTHSLHTGPLLSNFNRTQIRSASGIAFEKLSYLMKGNPSAVYATQVGQFVLVFKCNAQSAADMAQMEKSVLALKKLH